MADESKATQQLQALPQILGSHLYANAFGIVQSASDISIILIQNGAPIGLLALSYQTAKSLGAHITRAVQEYETAIGRTTPDLEEGGRGLQRLKDQGNAA